MTTGRSLRALLPLGIGFLLLLASAASAIWLSARQQSAVSWVRHTLEVENRIDLVQSLVTEAESGQRGYALEVVDELPAWREMHFRERRWFSVKDALRVVRDPEIRSILQTFKRSMKR